MRIRPARSAATFAGLAAAALYGGAARVVPGWGDAAELIGVARTWGVAHPPGYPLYSLITGAAAHLLPVAPALAVALVSALFGAVAAAVLAGLVARGGGRAAAAAGAFAALGMAAGRSLWLDASTAEVYTLHLALVAGLVGALLASARAPGRPGVGLAAAALFGLGLAHHPLVLAWLPVALGAVWLAAPAERRGRYLAGVAALGLAPLGFYALLPLASRLQPAFDWGDPERWGALVHHVTARQYAERAVGHPPAFVAAVLLGAVRRLPVEVPVVLVLLAPVGLVRVARVRPAAAWLLAAAAAAAALLAAATAASFNPPYFVPVAWALALLGGFGAVSLLASRRRWLAPGVLAALALNAAALLAVNAPLVAGRERALPRAYARALLAALPPDALVVTRSDSLSNLLSYERLLERQRPDVDILSAGDLAAVGSGAVLRRNYPRLVLPPGGYRYAEWPREVPGGWEVPDETRLLQLLIMNNARRPVYLEYAPGSEWAAPYAVPEGHLVRLGGERVGEIAGPDLQRHQRLLAELDGLAADARSPGARLTFSLAHNALGWYWLDRGEPARAVDSFRAAQAIDPDDSATLGNLAIALAQSGHTTAAEELFAAARATAPWSADLALNHARLLRSSGRPAEAAAAEAWATRLGAPATP